MKIEDEYSLLEKINETAGSRFYRAVKKDSGISVIVKYFLLDNPTKADRIRINQEFEIIKNIDCPGIIKTYDSVLADKEIAVVVEDFNGVPLHNLIKINNFSVETFIPIAEKLANTLGMLHEKGIIHFDIKPHNILINSKTSEVKIADFGIMARLTRSDRAMHLRKLEGTIGYVSPEQTGRINQPVDFRTDFYSLGVTFYEMLAGRLPFESDDPIEIIHSHLAKEPVPLNEVNPLVPDMISNVVLKLMSKRADDRYSSGYSLEYDLGRCRTSISGNGTIENFELGGSDFSTGFVITNKISGREKETALLLDSVKRVSTGAVEVVLVTGESGAGKTSLVNDIMRPVVASGGYFIQGKFDSFKREVPYSSIIQAFMSLIRQLLPQGDQYLEIWKHKILAAVGQNGKILTDMIPLAELIIGLQPRIADLNPEEAKNRFNFVLKMFISCFAYESKPLIIFFDDMQWIDPASLDFLSGFICDKGLRNILIIASYRNGEVMEGHILTGLLNTIKDSGVNITNIPVGPLDGKGISGILSGIFKKGDILSTEVVGLIKNKTNGNPFFVNQLIKSMFDEKLVSFKPEIGWTCNLKSISGMKVTNNVIELMAEKIARLPETSREILKAGSCIGERFDIQTLSAVTGKPLEEIIESLSTIVNEGYLTFADNIYTFYHNRIIEAANSLLSDKDRCKIHYAIGKFELDAAGGQKLFQEIFHLVVDKTDLDVKGGEKIFLKIFYIVNQFNRGIPEIKNSDEIFFLSEINRLAGRKAKGSAAYESAASYFRTSMDLAGASIWNKDYNYAYSLCMDLAECEYLSSRFSESEKIFAEVLLKSADGYDRAAVHNKLALLYTSMNKPAQAVAEGVRGLHMLGIRVPKHPGKLRVAVEFVKYLKLMRGKKISDIYDLPEMKDREKLLALAILSNIGTAAYYINPDQFAVFVFTSVNISLKYGNCRHSAFSYMAFGSILSTAFGRQEEAYRLGLMSMRLNEKFEAVNYRCKTNFSFAYFIQGWVKHIKENYQYFNDGYKYGIESGDHIFAGHCVNNLFFHKIIAGYNLDEAYVEYFRRSSFLKGIKDIFLLNTYIENESFYLSLKGRTEALESVSDNIYNEITREAEIIANANSMELFMYYLNKIKINFFYGRNLTAYTISQKMLPILKIPVGSLHIPEFHFYQSLIILSIMESLNKSEKKQAMKLFRKNIKYFKKLSEKNEITFLHKYCFFLGEYSIIKKRHLKAITYIHRAINLAKESGFTQDAAIFNMRTGEYYKRFGQPDLGDYHLIRAHKFFRRWGADGVCAYLLEKYPHLADKKIDIAVKDKPESAIGSIGNGNDLLDISTVIKASQAISGEIRIEKLLETLMNIMMENAGAQKGAIIFEWEHSLFIEASGSINSKIEVCRVPIGDESTMLPNSLINYVNKTMETLVLDDASNFSLFLYDKYIIKNSPKSVLCLPFTGKGEARAILYLENNLITGGFTADRIQLLRILLSQAAISIENTRLVSVEMQNAVLEREIMMAQDIQNSLLPERLPATDKIEVAYRYIPMMGVGGDFISVKYWPESDKAGLFICDVSGHGIPAAFTSTMVSMALDFLWRIRDDNPKNTLTEIKKLLEGKLAGSFFTACICIVDLKNRTVTACNAGHPPMILLSRNMEPRYIFVKGRMISETFALNHEEIVFKMEPGDRLVLYTDGITEAAAYDGSMLGDDSNYFLNWIKDHSDNSKTVDDLCSNIFKGVTSFAGKVNVDDDITILAAEFF